MPGRGKRSGNPFRGVVDIVSEMGRMADRMTAAEGALPRTTRGHADAWSPTIDILAAGGDLVIRCELPGVPRENIEVSLSRGTLTIAGERPGGSEQDDDFYVRERSFGNFRRDITLPEGVREDHIEAEFTEGVLAVTARNAAGAPGPARIDIRGARNER